ncbi:MAG TPA: XrtA system polysaccharide deacetylase [Alphaproteobacteria bacterium]|nr:XrtA system polysaccharide deacetylase [Alphaproteobacteria bacterium]
MPGSATGPQLINALTIDLEEYFQVSAFADAVPKEDWSSLPSRIEPQTERLLALLEQGGAHATFFVLGWVAERHPALIRRIAAAGHEIASHGWAHVRVSDQRPEEFAEDVRRSRELLEGIAGVEVRGYRAASFSIDHRTVWAFELLAEAGYRYSSSVYPIRHDHYGWPEAPRLPFRPSPAGVPEIPIATVRLFGGNRPCGGGGYFRLFPYALSCRGLRRFNEREDAPAVFYLHGWELDPDQPIPTGIGARARLRHRLNLGRMEGRLQRLLGDFRWGRMDEVFRDLANGLAAPVARAP